MHWKREESHYTRARFQGTVNTNEHHVLIGANKDVIGVFKATEVDSECGWMKVNRTFVYRYVLYIPCPKTSSVVLDSHR